jgi:hypothetical protein
MIGTKKTASRKQADGTTKFGRHTMQVPDEIWEYFANLHGVENAAPYIREWMIRKFAQQLYETQPGPRGPLPPPPPPQPPPQRPEQQAAPELDEYLLAEDPGSLIYIEKPAMCIKCKRVIEKGELTIYFTNNQGVKRFRHPYPDVQCKPKD